MDEIDSLKDWLVIVDDPFVKPLTHERLIFHVAWNNIDRKVNQLTNLNVGSRDLD